MDSQQIRSHRYANYGKQYTQCNGALGHLTRNPRSRAKFSNEQDMTNHSIYVNHHPKGNERDSGPDGYTRVASGYMHLFSPHLPQEQAETRDREADTHQSQAGPYPGEECPLSGEVHPWIVLTRRAVHVSSVGPIALHIQSRILGRY